MKKRVFLVSCPFEHCYCQFATAHAMLYHLQVTHRTSPFHDIFVGSFDAKADQHKRDRFLWPALRVRSVDDHNLILRCKVQRNMTHLTWMCATCHSTFGTLHDLSMHAKMTQECRAFQCQRCLELFEDLETLHLHQLESYAPFADSPIILILTHRPQHCEVLSEYMICSHCGVNFRSGDTYPQRHLASHREDQQSEIHPLILSKGEHVSNNHQASSCIQSDFQRVIEKVHSHYRCRICRHMLPAEVSVVDHLSS